ncbi:ABC transporter ATP-binding protein [Conexibacter woesei]|uniref:ABC transporter related protein n=1 Tax=Conexibacter woesei (strain DSM 14684 / CCUG 47730 / CIP 108061 / JCM 11494 / NBRC 100937 / ID131577) TaxID=469383 RepID=D3FAL6_CONWI|nr:ABC transporter ATP-binding protein [Conexibacter woesei]ADB51179.1 ABC transporter related protein [Conexibacter woesei DSM 14684]
MSNSHAATIDDPVDDAAAAPAIELADVTQNFALDGLDFTALERISLSIARGEFVSLVGPSGCGKSTLLRIIAGLLAPSGGTVSIGGQDPATARAAREFGFVFQDPVLLPWRTALENVELPALVAKQGSKADRRAHARELLELVGLGDFAAAPPAALSGGMQRRVGIARALALDPSILLLDEPFGALDEITRQKMNSELLRIWSERRTTALLVTHNVGEAVYLSDRVFVMAARPGRIVAEVAIDLPRPRTLDLLEQERFFAHTKELTRLLLHDAEETAP